VDPVNNGCKELSGTTHIHQGANMRSIKHFKMSAITLGLALGLASNVANAMVAVESGTVSSTVTENRNGSFDYRFTVFNGPGVSSITSFALPYFNDAGITGITGPASWSWVQASDAVFGVPPTVLRWTTSLNPVGPDGSLSGFGFTSTFAPVKGPYALGFDSGNVLLGDPPIPGSPNTREAGFTVPFPVTAVPEPETYALMLAGLGLIGLAARRRARHH
jgi:hypothetical protein